MWIKSHSRLFQGVTRERIWQLWADINNWHTWDTDIDYAHLEGPFAKGAQFTLKPKGASAVTIELVNVQEGVTFTDCTRFFGAAMYTTHHMIEENGGLRVTVTMNVKGPLSFIWRKLVAENIAKELPAQLENLEKRAKEL